MGRLVLLGAGHAHLAALMQIGALRERGHEVTVVGPHARHCYSGMGPGVLGGLYAPEDSCIKVRQLVEARGGTYVEDVAVRLDAAARTVVLSSGRALAYDVCSCNTGSQVPMPQVHGAGSIFAVKPIENLAAAREWLLQCAARGPARVGVVGGGPAALEVACNVAACLRDMRMGAGVPGEGGLGERHAGDSVVMLARRGVMERVEPAVRKLAMQALHGWGVDVREHSPVQDIREGSICCAGGEVLSVDMVLVATGVQPSPLFAVSGVAAGPDGGLAVNAYLQSVEHDTLFGGGDCIWFTPSPLPRVGVHAVREAPVLAHNLLARLEDRPLQAYVPQKKFLLILNTGGGTGILHWGRLLFGGTLAMRIKDWIDRRFVGRFQA